MQIAHSPLKTSEQFLALVVAIRQFKSTYETDEEIAEHGDINDARIW